ncbi:unnamed protein product [Schistosoma margrebowiei]|uniref:Uncharacterized protein n=2 Tax=Schistosoma TaxID=6181 RepID=A0A183LNP5_9TREM|nr:unnamed protein product [Schistosoma margrebowiei]
MSMFRLLCFLFTIILAICTLGVGLILSPYWKDNEEPPREAKIHLSLSLISILFLGASGLLILVSIVSGPGRTKKIIIITMILLILTILCMKTLITEEKYGIQWTDRMQLGDLDFADDLTTLSHTQQQMQEKTTSVTEASAAVGFNIRRWTSKILRYNTACNNRITLDGEAWEDVKSFTYMGSIIDKHGGSDVDVKAWIDKVRAEYLEFKTNYRLIPKSEFSIQMSRQFY